MSTFFKVQTDRNCGITSFLTGDPSDWVTKRLLPVKTIAFYIVLLVGKVLFITENDIWGAGTALYPMDRVNAITGQPFDDRQHILYVNASYDGDDPLGILMHDFLCSDPDDMKTPLLAEKARYLKTDPKGVELMCKAMEELREQSYQRGIEQNRVESIKSIMETLKLTAEQAMAALKIPAADQSKYLAKL